jgi:hypothetical protein
VRAYAETGAEVTPGVVSDVVLYVFDGAERFVERIETELGVSVSIAVPEDGRFNIVAWGNLGGGRQSVSTLLPGDNMSAAAVTLLPDTRAATPHFPCDDLFHGAISVTDLRQTENILIPMHRKAGSMTLTVRKLKEYSGFLGDDFWVLVRETYHSIAFDGTYTGDKASYRPEGAFAADGALYVPPFNMLPGAGLAIDIYHGPDLIHTASVSGGSPIDVTAGKSTHVLIDFTGNISVSVATTDWGQQYVWKEY